MLKPLLGIAATGVVAVLAWKLMVLFLLPLLGLAIGVILFVLMIGYWIFRRLTRGDSVTA